MKRWLVRICVFLVLGAIVNVAVAWAIAMYVDIQPLHTPQMFRLREHSMTDWGIFRATAFGSEAVERMEFIARGKREVTSRLPVPRWSGMAGQPAIGNAAPMPDRSDARGWPMYALCNRYFRGPTPISISTVHDGLVIGRWRGDSSDTTILPLRPIWPGFAINTAFYAVILWLLFAVPCALRRRRRIKRGLCPKCAYPVGTNEVCTECGAAVTQRKPNIAEGVP